MRHSGQLPFNHKRIAASSRPDPTPCAETRMRRLPPHRRVVGTKPMKSAKRTNVANRATPVYRLAGLARTTRTIYGTHGSLRFPGQGPGANKFRSFESIRGIGVCVTYLVARCVPRRRPARLGLISLLRRTDDKARFRSRGRSG